MAIRYGSLCRSITARQGDVGKVRPAFIVGIIKGKKFAAPDGSVIAIAGSVKSNPDSRPVNAMFCKAPGHVGKMMLHADSTGIVLLQGISCGTVVRMKIIGNDFGRYLQNIFKMRLLIQGKFVSASTLSISPIYWLKKATLDLVKQMVFFSSAPQASTSRPSSISGRA